MSEGRGAWTTIGKDNGTTYYACIPGSEPAIYDGANPTTSAFHKRVTYGVAAIHRLLTLAGYPKSILALGDFTEAEWGLSSSIYGKTMAARVKRYQIEVLGLTNPAGYVGDITMKSLMRPHILSIANARGMAPRFLWGQTLKESTFDPGAQGAFDSLDSGLNQHHVDPNNPNSVTLEDAYDPMKSERLAADRWVERRDIALAADLARDKAVNAAILQHWSPTASTDYVNSGGEWPGPDSREYVALTREAALTWPG